MTHGESIEDKCKMINQRVSHLLKADKMEQKVVVLKMWGCTQKKLNTMWSFRAADWRSRNNDKRWGMSTASGLKRDQHRRQLLILTPLFDGSKVPNCMVALFSGAMQQFWPDALCDVNNDSYKSNNKKAQLSLTNPRDACEKFARFT